MSNISKAYADALFELSIEENILDEIMEQTQSLAEILSQNADFLKLLNAPTVTKEEKVTIADNVFSGKINKHLLNFIKVMIQFIFHILFYIKLCNIYAFTYINLQIKINR